MANVQDQLSRALAGPGTVYIQRYVSETELSADQVILSALKDGIDFKATLDKLEVSADSCYAPIDEFISGIKGDGELVLLDVDAEMIHQFLGGTLVSESGTENRGVKFYQTDVENAAVTARVKFVPKSTKAAGKGVILYRCKVSISELNMGMKRSELRSYKVTIKLLEPPVTTPATPYFYVGALTLAEVDAPSATTSAASSVGADEATMNGSVNPNGSSTVVKFEWGETVSYGNVITAAESPATGSSAVSVSAYIGGLEAETAYHFRCVAWSDGGLTVGADATFTTTAS